MTRVKKCDQCDKVEKGFDWITVVKKFGVVGHEDVDLDFCSWQCTAKFAAEANGPQ